MPADRSRKGLDVRQPVKMTTCPLLSTTSMQNSDTTAAFMKGPKRKRLAKACDACHKSKRRCDGTAPCSNCYYASKQCTYTDASGRSVPAPRPFKPERQDPQASSSSSETRPYPQSHYGSSSNQFRIYPSQSNAPSHQFQNDNSDDDDQHTRKRFRNERGNPIPVDELVIEGPIASVVVDRPAPIELDPSLTRELTNLFFTHCNPARTVIHKPTFSSSLSHNRVPSHLLLAVCALAAPLSKQPRIRTTPSRFAGKPFAQEALSQMFNDAGRLVVEPNLATAQALCVLQMHDILTNERNAVWSSRFHDLALQIVESLGVHSPEHPTLTPFPSQEFVQGSIERESVRRIFWLIHVLDVLASIFFKKPTTFADVELRLRLPVDETSFELGVHSTLPEYLYLPAVRTRYASEFGHLIRILSIYAKMECVLDDTNDPETSIKFPGVIAEAEQKLDEWDRTLPDHLRFSEQSLQVQQSMLETSSNTGAWSWCCIHVYHASCALALNSARQRNQRGLRNGPQWALERIESILQLLGDRAKNSLLMGSALWSLIKYCKRDDSLIRKWAAEYEEASGTKMVELVQDWRSQPSPPLRHTQHLHAQSQQQQHNHSISFNPQLPPPHRRLSDVHNPGTQGTSYDDNNAISHTVKRSSSHSPVSYGLGRPSHLVTNNDDSISVRNLSVSQQHGSSSDSSVIGNFNDGKDMKTHTPTSNSSNFATSLLEHSGKNEDQPPYKVQKLGTTGSYGVRDASMHQSRWTNIGNDPVRIKTDDGTRTGYSVSNSNGSSSAISGVAIGANKTGVMNFSTVSGDGNQSLPSLKASGLLDSWGASRSIADIPKPKPIASGTHQPLSLLSPRRSSPPISNVNITSTHHSLRQSDSSDLRPSTLAMPVGMPWLANESR